MNHVTDAGSENHSYFIAIRMGIFLPISATIPPISEIILIINIKMGNFLNFVGSQGEIKTVCPLINLSLSKIRELHGGFKSICDNFAINLTEFETIF